MAVNDGLPATDLSRMNREYVKNLAEGESVPDGLPATDLSRMNRDWIKAVVEEAGGGGGGGDITVEAATFTENGTFTAPEGKAYSPVTVDVPSSAPALGPYKYVMGQITPETAGGIDFQITVPENIDAVKFGVIWLDDNSVISHYSSSSIMLISDSPEHGGSSTITHMTNGSQAAELKTAYGLFVSKATAHNIRFWYKSYQNWPAQPETYNYIVVYSVTE